MKLDTIQFTDTSGTGKGHALALRKNAHEALPIPEWSSDRPNIYENSSAAYAIEPNRNSTLSIKVQLSTSLPSLQNQEVEIRALQPPIGLALSTHVNVLGEVKARKIRFDQAGQSKVETFELINHRLATRGVGINQVIWHWQFRPSRDHAWQNFEITVHKIYTILGLPTSPWTQNLIDNSHLLWTEVLDYACTWANRAQTEKQAAGLITTAVFNLGPSILEYNCVNFLPGYIIPLNIWGDSYFDCQAFIQHLKTGLVNRFIICSDCACIVSTFANALGCSLWQSKMYTQGVNYFKINPILAIGNFQWNLPCGIPGFAFHEVAWSGACLSNDDIYDACLAIDQDANPTFAPHFPLLAEGLKFGQVGEGLYRDRLAFPTDVLLCNPQPEDRQRRRLTAPLQTPMRSLRQKALPFDNDRYQLLKDKLNFEEWMDRNQLEESLFIFNHQIPQNSLSNWRTQYSNKSTTPTNRPMVIDDLWRPAGYAYQAIKITKYESSSRQEAHELLIRLMANAHIPIDYHAVDGLGDVAFAGPRRQTVLFARGNVVMVLSNADRVDLDLVAHAKKIDASFCERKEDTLEKMSMVKAKAKSTKTAPVKLVKAKGGKIRIEILQQPLANVLEKQKGPSKAAVETTAEAPAEINNLRFFSTDGEIVLENEELVLVPRTKKAKPQVAVYYEQDKKREEAVL